TYAANAQVFGTTTGAVTPSGGQTVSNGQKVAPIWAIMDGASNTLVFTEKYGNAPNPPITGGTGGTVWGRNNNTSSGAVSGGSYIPFFGSIKTSGYTFQPRPIASEYNYPASPHPSGINALMGDGSVRFIGNDISLTSWWAACTPNAGDR